MKNKVIKIILTVFLILLVLFIIHTGRNLVILKKIVRLQSQYSQTDNHYEKIKNDLQNVVTEYYYKDGRSKLIMNRISDSQMMITTYDGKYRNTYINNNGDKKAILKEENDIMTNIMIIKLDSANDFKFLFTLATSSFIHSENIDGKECYVINGIDFGCKTYFDKETGLMVQRIDNTSNNKVTTINFEYKFNVVTNEDLTEPDISEYKIQEKN